MLVRLVPLAIQTGAAGSLKVLTQIFDLLGSCGHVERSAAIELAIAKCLQYCSASRAQEEFGGICAPCALSATDPKQLSEYKESSSQRHGRGQRRDVEDGFAPMRISSKGVLIPG